MFPPLGVTGKPEPVAGAVARAPAVTVADDTVSVRAYCRAAADRVAELPSPNDRTVPEAMGAGSRSTGRVVAALIAAAHVTIC